MEKVAHTIAALPTDKKSLSKMEKRILTSKKIEVENDEILAMIDSGSFTHAINAAKNLPLHRVTPPGARERRRKAETACGGILEIKGTVELEAEVDGHTLGIKFHDMDVNTPILSVRRMVKDGYIVYVGEDGGFIQHVQTGKKMHFFEHQGVYYMKLKIKDAAGFGRQGA